MARARARPLMPAPITVMFMLSSGNEAAALGASRRGTVPWSVLGAAGWVGWGVVGRGRPAAGPEAAGAD
ncbi:hypothetical protein GCM10017782_19810 [Deinococcus ficus]|nr:hypothetical protein GCM10017782_19810 [Deinococcus ficus]